MLSFQSCVTEEDDNIFENLGWIGADEENTDAIEDDISLGTNFGSGDLPSEVSLLDNFPPIGNQGAYGTCVAWACGYNLKSFLESKANGYVDYTSSDKLFSAKDLFWAIDNSKKGDDCNGTGFEVALDVVQSRGVATMSTVPYEDLGDCSSSPESSWTSDAGNHKIESYREIDVDAETIKSYLAQGRAVVFGAKLGDEFMNAKSDAVLDYQTYGYSGQHAYHAMILSGYDDNKGSNGAFRVVNSWGQWGDNGYIWVDYDFFCNKDDFCFCAFVATDTQTNPDGDGDNEVDDPNSGYDLVAWELNDTDYYLEGDPDSDDPRWRTSLYNVYNSGENTLNATDDWYIVYFLYNAYDGDDYTIILVDYYSDDFGNFGENGGMDADPNIPAQGYWWNNVDVVSGQSVTNAVNGFDTPFEWSYKMPDVTGDYYLVIFADGFGEFDEFDESNNWTYYTDANGEPLEIINGVIQNAPAKKTMRLPGEVPFKGQASINPSMQTKKNMNTYTTKEIGNMIKIHRENGEMQKRVIAHTKSGNQTKGRK